MAVRKAIPSLEFEDEELERDFQKENSSYARTGVAITASVFCLIFPTILLIDLITGKWTIARLFAAGLITVGMFYLFFRAQTLSNKSVRRVGYSVNIMILVYNAFSEVHNPVQQVALDTTLLFLANVLVLRSFRIVKWVVTPVSIAEAAMFFIRSHDLDDRPMEQKLPFYVAVMLGWVLAPSIMAYYIEKELRNSFLYRHHSEMVSKQQQLIFSRLTLAVVLVSNDRVVWKNPACEKIFSVGAIEIGESIGRNWISNESNDELQEWMSECHRSQCVKTAEFYYFDSNPDPNHSTFLHVDHSWILWNGQRQSIFMFTDRTVEEDANKFKYKWLSTVSHEFRTPLNIVCAMIDSLKEERVLSKVSRDFLSLGDNSTKLLKVYVGDLVDYCLLRNQKFFITCKPIKIVDFLSQTIGLLRMKAQDKNLSLKFELALSPTLETISSDEGRIQQVLINLLANAIKFSTNGGTITVTLTDSVRPREVCIRVKDTGIGIREEDQARLFTEYGRIIDEETTSLNPQGVGLGLWICKQFCEQLGSGITVKSQYAKGTEFTFTVKDRSQDGGSFGNSPGSSSSSENSSRILLLDAKTNTPGELSEDEGNGNGTNSKGQDYSPCDRDSDLSDSSEVQFKKQKFPRWPKIRGYSGGIHAYSKLRKPSSSFGDVVGLPFETTLNRFTEEDESKKTRISRGNYVLIVDDEPVNRLILKHFCERLGLKTKFAVNGEEALEVFLDSLRTKGECREKSSERIGMIILDYQMPIMTGPELAQRLQALKVTGEISEVPPIIGYTALISRVELDFFLDSGVIDILEKPTTFDSFKMLMRKFDDHQET